MYWKSVLMFLHCLKWVFQPVFYPFNNAFWLHLMKWKWDQERVRLAMVKSKLPPRSGSSLEAVEPHPKKGAIKLLFFFFFFCPLWMSSGWGRVKYLNHDEWKYYQVYGLMRRSKSRIIRQYKFIQTLTVPMTFCKTMSSVIYKTVIWNVVLVNCTFQLNRTMQINLTPLNIYWNCMQHFIFYLTFHMQTTLF